MQISSLHSNSFTQLNSSSDENYKKALMQLPSDEIPKFIDKTADKKDENQIKKIAQELNSKFMIYA